MRRKPQKTWNKILSLCSQDVSHCPSNAEFLLGHRKGSILEARVALQLLSEELLLPLPHEWALLPWTIEEPASSPLPSWVAQVFSWPTLDSTIELF